MTDLPAETLDTAANPFLGLRPFRPEHSYLYFGREQQVREMQHRLELGRFLAVVGDSGVGKSSLVFAGLIPELLRGKLVGKYMTWRFVRFQPERSPIHNLATAIALAARDNGQAIDPNDLERKLRLSSLALVRAVRSCRLTDGANVVLFSDQFEEIFAFLDEHRNSTEARQEAALYVKQLLEASRDLNEPIYVLLTMRSEYLGRVIEFTGLPEALNSGQFLVPQLTRPQLREAIIGPLAVRGAGFSEALIQRVLNESSETGSVLPLLQHALRRTWTRAESENPAEIYLKPEHFHGLASELSDHAESVWNSLPESSRALAILVFQVITHKDAAGRTRRRKSDVRTILDITGAGLDQLREVINAFADEDVRILRIDPLPLTHDSLVDIVHESVISRWPRLQKAVDDEGHDVNLLRDAVSPAVPDPWVPSEFWRGVKLKESLDWATRPHHNRHWAARYIENPDAIDRVRAFIEASYKAQLAEENRQRRQLQLALAAVALFVAIAGLAGWFAYRSYQSEKALKETSGRLQDARTKLAYTENRLGAASSQLIDTDSKLLQQKQLLEQNIKQVAANQALLLAASSTKNFNRGEAIGALNDATKALEQSIASGSLPREVGQALAKAIQGAGAVQVYSAEEKLRDFAAAPNVVSVLLNSGHLETGRLGCSSRSARGGIIDDFFEPDYGGAVQALSSLNTATAVNFVSFTEILAGYRNGDVWRIRLPPQGSDDGAVTIDSWGAQSPSVQQIAETAAGVVTLGNRFLISRPGAVVRTDFGVTSREVQSREILEGTSNQVVAFAADSRNGDVIGLIDKDQKNSRVRLFSTSDSDQITFNRGAASTRTKAPLMLTWPEEPPEAIAFDPSGQFVATSSDPFEVYIYEYGDALRASSASELKYLEHLNLRVEGPTLATSPRAMSWSPNGNRIAVADSIRIVVLNRRQPDSGLMLAGPALPVRRLRWITDSRLVSLDADSTITVWDLDRAAALYPALKELASLSPGELGPGSKGAQAASDLLATLRKLLETTIRPLPPCGR